MITNDELRLKVRQIINEMHDDSAVTLLSDDTRSIDEHIAALLPDAVLSIQRNKGWGSLNPKDATDAKVKDNTTGELYCSFITNPSNQKPAEICISAGFFLSLLITDERQAQPSVLRSLACPGERTC